MQQLKERALKRANLTEEDVLRAIEERTLARKNKDFARSDQIRTDLAAKGISLMDITGTTETDWRPCIAYAAVQEQPVAAPSQQMQPAAAAVQQEQSAAAPVQQEHPMVPPQ